MDEGDESGAEVVPDGDGDPVQRDRGAPHALRRLVIEKLEVCDGHKDFGDPVETELGDEPEGAEDDVAGAGGSPASLDGGGDEGGEDIDGEADAHALETSYSGGEAGEASS